MNVANASGTEDGYVELAVTVDKSSPAGFLQSTVSGIPEGAILGTYDSDSDTWVAFTPNDDGTYTLTDSGGVNTIDLSDADNNLAIDLLTNDSQEFDITIAVTEREGDATPSNAISQTFSVTVDEVSDPSTISFTDASGQPVSLIEDGDGEKNYIEDQAIPLSNGTLDDLIAGNAVTALITATPDDVLPSDGAEEITQINISIVDGGDPATFHYGLCNALLRSTMILLMMMRLLEK